MVTVHGELCPNTTLWHNTHAARSNGNFSPDRTSHRPVPTDAKAPACADVVPTERHRRVLACADDAEVPTVSGGTSAPVGADDVLVPTY